jgi:hypothetical protein
MSKKIILFLTLSACISSHSQFISKQVIGSAGSTQTNSNLKVSFSVGELVVGIMTTANNQLGNGYWPSLNLQSLNIEDTNLEEQLKIYPNPTTQFISISHPLISLFEVVIQDINGKKLFDGGVNSEEPLNFSNYSSGIYLLTIKNNSNNKKNTYKIIKK